MDPGAHRPGGCLRQDTANLKTPVRIIIAYFTAVASDEGKVSFREDVYKRDAPLLKALDGDFKLREQDR